MEAYYKTYKPAWKSFYKQFFLMFLILVLAIVVSMYALKPEQKKLEAVILCAALALDVLICICTMVKRSCVSLILRDNPAKPEDQEIAFIEYHPTKFFSSEFKKSIEIPLTNIVDTTFKQSGFQVLFNIGEIVITSSGTADKEIRAKSMPNPQAICDEIQIHRSKYTSQTPPTSAPVQPEQ